MFKLSDGNSLEKLITFPFRSISTTYSQQHAMSSIIHTFSEIIRHNAAISAHDIIDVYILSHVIVSSFVFVGIGSEMLL